MVKNFNLVDWGIDETGQWWYFTMAPKDLRAEFPSEDIEVVYEMYRAEDVYMSQFAEEVQAQIKEASSKLAGQGTQALVTLKEGIIKT